MVPEFWKYGIINPIPKAGGTDNRIPLKYRGVTLTSSVYKLFCSVLYNRIAEWAEANDIIADEQNGFRKKRSCLDHIATLTTIIDARKKLKKATFCSFTDFSKAFDHIDRNMLWNKLSALGLHGNILNCLSALYENVKCCVRVNGCLTDWFPVDIGVKHDKTKVVHFRNPSMPLSEFSFSCGSFSLETAKEYKYLGLMLKQNF